MVSVIGMRFAKLTNQSLATISTFICLIGTWSVAMAAEIDRIVSPLSISGDCFGCSVAISGDTLAIGEPAGAVQGSEVTGVVNVYVWNGVDFVLQQRIRADDIGAEDRFGESVDIEGDTLVVGSSREDQSAGDNRGSAYVFIRSNSMWTQQAKVSPNDLLPLAFFGSSISLEGETMLVGAPGQTDVVMANQQIGTAYVFTRNGTAWSQQGKLDPSDGALKDAFGFSVDLSGDTALIGAPSGPTAVNADTGVAYVFVRNGTTWSFQQKLVGILISAADRIGESVGLDGNTAIVGAPFDDVVNVGNDAGSVYIFVRSGTTWTEQQKILSNEPAASTFFGRRVSIYGEDVGIASTEQTQPNPGALRRFRRSANQWSFNQKFVATTIGGLGASVTMDDSFILGAGFGGLAIPGLHVLVFSTNIAAEVVFEDGFEGNP